MGYRKIEGERRSPHLGAFIGGIDLSDAIAEQTVNEIRTALLEFCVRGWGASFRMLEGGEDKLHELKRIFPLMTHPILRTHPETGRTALYVNEYYTSRINELSEAEIEALLKLLNHHSQLPDFQIRHSWQTNDIAFWDNRCTQRYASNDYGAAHRIMNRVTLVGDKPYYRKSTE